MPAFAGSDRERSVTVTLGISPSGEVRVISTLAGAREGAGLEAAKRAAERAPSFDLPFDEDYTSRKGFDPAFLDLKGKSSALHVQLPTLSPSLESEAAPLLPPAPAKEYVLGYHHYSLVMHAKRRLAIYSAANVDFAGRFEMSRPKDVWRSDPRIAADAQLTNFYYRANQFDRGHLTRREDLEYGKSWKAALASAADTCHWTNCTPQHAQFNQNKALWQGIERYILEGTIEADNFRAQVITGPILSEDDPTWEAFPKIQYPVRFWKVVAAVTGSGKLFATAYILDQSDVIAQFGIEEAKEIPFGAYKTFQVTVADVERETGLTFTSGSGPNAAPLRNSDPLATAPERVRRRRVRLDEAARNGLPESYRLLESVDSIYLEE